MIDDDLRAMFAEREVFVPPPGRTAAMISEGIPRRRRRRRATGAVLCALAVLGVVAAVPIALNRPDRDTPTAVEPSGSPSGSPSAVPVALVPAPGDVDLTLAVSPGRLPAEPNKTDASIRPGQSDVLYQFADGGRVRSVTISASDGVPDLVVPPTDPSWTDVDVNGVPGRQRTAVQTEQGIRVCLLAWQDGARWLSIVAYDVGTTPSCAVALEVARNLKRKPMTLPRTVRVGLVPQGYTMASTGTMGETWCPPGTPRGQQMQGCLTARRDPVSEGFDGTPVIVRGRAGVLQRTETVVTVYVTGYLWLEMSTPQGDPRSAPLTDADLLQIAESVEIS
ncbi:hypothetical protein KZZ52_57200 [Dactylosporangium sp. AC04546]|uniref:hypothetical protein n=1 Tax=Dactylosporangium sp. AC04546 TaxID=2862460 RepID=UPI001EE11546|nr:hypothetical protein [Dactylosporangium sp. AC04546]WVK83349.1 hypothetical protein KZZ52_57200 [Dactylosporangium sp. AC04546]